MIYVYCALVSFGANVAFLVSLIAFGRWALPRYGANVMRMAIKPTISGTYTRDK